MDKDLRTYLLGGGAAPARLAREFGDDDLSLSSLSNWSFTRRWAWDELVRRLRVCLDKGDTPTGILAFWAASVVVAGRKRPRHNAHEDRNWRVLAVVNVLKSRGLTERAAVHTVAREIEKTPEAVYSVLRKIRQGPFKRGRSGK